MSGKTRKYTIKPIQPNDDHDDVMDFLKRTFFIEEPLNKVVELYTDDYKSRAVEEWSSALIKAGYSLKAVDENNDIVGVMLNNMLFNERNVEQLEKLTKEADSCSDPRFRKLLKFFAVHEGISKFQMKFSEVERMLQVLVAATDSRWRGMGIMTELMRATEKIAKDLGVSHVRMDTSSAFSSIVAKKLNYECISKIKFTDIDVYGERICPEPPHIYDQINVKVLE